ncbi:hypothetical protein QZJ86_06230 [Methylomonas montana]|uniref:hypothetical protein n=1 Tax=Methylomonas montana TaxID=3058963 RepID=UPI00265B2497|nr:hypothetical protein [Methylomonas montana]WKJ91732.1 hypothetical protein QZJ86_06230 [Methylomonas montana]
MKSAKWIVALFSFVFISCATAEQPSIEQIAEHFVLNISQGWNSYSICEHRDRAEQYSYLKQLLPKSQLPTRTTITTRHLVVQNHSDSIGIDLSIYQVTFESIEAAKPAFAEISDHPIGTIPDGKVLTKYAARLEGRSLYVIRTQSVFDPTVATFLKSFSE